MAERALATAFVSIVPTTLGFDTALRSQLGGKMDSHGVEAATGFKRGFSGVLGTMGNLFAAGFVASQVAGFTRSLVTAAEAEVVGNRRLENIANSMGLFGDNTKAVVERLKDYATQQQLNNGIDDDAIKSAQAKLLTFSEVGKTADVVGGAFDRATKATIDLAAAGFGTVENNSVQLGKALQDPIKGISALARSGVTFSEAEKARIATLVKSNEIGKAQAVILSAIEMQVGNTADATRTGSDRMREGFENLKETVGLQLLPTFDKFAKFVADNVLPGVTAGVEKLPAVFAKVGQFFAPTIAALQPVFAQLGNLAGPLVPLFLDLAKAISPLGLLSQALLPALAPLLAAIGPVFISALATIVPMLTELSQTIGSVLGDAVAVVLPVILQLVGVFGSLAQNILPTLAPIMKTVGEVVAIVVAAFLPMVPLIGNLIASIGSLISAILPPLLNLLGAILPIVVPLAGFLSTVLSVALQVVINVLTFLVQVVTNVVNAFFGMWAAVLDVGKKLFGWFQALPGQIASWFSGVGSWLFDAGRNMIQGLLDGIGSFAGKIGDWFLKILPDWIREPFKQALGIHSPSTVFHNYGVNIIEGLIAGVKSMQSPMAQAMEGLASDVESPVMAMVKTVTGEMVNLTELVNTRNNAFKSYIGLGYTQQEAFAKLKAIDQGQIGLDKMLGQTTFMNKDSGLSITASGTDFTPEWLSKLPSGYTPVTPITSNGQVVNYFAAPNASLDSEQALADAMIRTRVLTSWMI